MAIISRHNSTSFYGHFTIVSMSHCPWKKKFLNPKKNFFWPHFFFFFFLNLFFKHHRNYGDIMPGFGTWSKSIIFMVKTFAVQVNKWFSKFSSSLTNSAQDVWWRRNPETCRNIIFLRKCTIIKCLEYKSNFKKFVQ